MAAPMTAPMTIPAFAPDDKPAAGVEPSTELAAEDESGMVLELVLLGLEVEVVLVVVDVAEAAL